MIPRAAWAASLLVALGCRTSDDVSDPLVYACGTVSDPSTAIAGAPDDCKDIDDTLPPEPSLPAVPSDPSCILQASRTTTDTNWVPAEDPTLMGADLDTARIQGALNTCPVVQLVANGDNNAFLTSHLAINGAVLWVDKGVTLYASRNADMYQKTGNCGVAGVNDSQACNDFITVSGASPGIVGEGIIDGQGGEPIFAGGMARDYSWWQLSSALQLVDGSIGNPTLINLSTGTTQFLMYKITLHNSPKFHVKITSTPVGGLSAACTQPGQGFIVWGITILTPSRWFNSQGLLMSPHLSRNTDGVDPGETSYATCGLIAHNTISTGDDHVAVKGGHGINNLWIVHNHFGTGHGMSIGSETYGGVHNMHVCDLTIDADSRPVGEGASPGDFNGIRVKSDASRGGIVDQIEFRNVCMRDVTNAILVSTAYNPLFEGTLYPQFGAIAFRNLHSQTCMSKTQPVVTLNGFSPAYPAGPLTLDNAIVDNVGPSAVEAEFSSVVLGPGPVNFGSYITTTQDVTVSPASAPPTGAPPINCVFPTLPAPQPPAGWSR
jgi:polygalacturonase